MESCENLGTGSMLDKVFGNREIDPDTLPAVASRTDGIDAGRLGICKAEAEASQPYITTVTIGAR